MSDAIAKLDTRVTLSEHRIDDCEAVQGDHEKRIRWTEGKMMLFIGGMGTVQTIILLAVEWLRK